jgi:hypothetical protein
MTFDPNWPPDSGTTFAVGPVTRKFRDQFTGLADVYTQALAVAALLDPAVAGEYIRWNLAGTRLEPGGTPAYALGDFLQSGTGAVERTAISKLGEIVSVTDFGADVTGVADASTAFQAAMDAIAARASGAITRGFLIIPPGEYRLDTQLEIEEQAIHFLGQEGAVIRWNGDNTHAIFHVVDSSRCAWDNLVLLGKDAAPPTAAIYFDQPVAGDVGTNELHIVRRCLFGRRWIQDATAAGALQRGVWVGGAFNGNNDQFAIYDSHFDSCSTAGVAIDNHQSIWGIIQNCSFQLCGYGINAGASFLGTNLQFNRNTVCDLKVFRDMAVFIRGLFSEHAAQIIDVAQDCALHIDGGHLVIHPEMTGAYWGVVNAAKKLSLRNLKMLENGATGKKLQITPSSSSGATHLYVRSCELPKGDDGTEFALNVSTGTRGIYADIEHGPYALKGFFRHALAYDPASLADAAGISTSTTGATIGLAAGALVVPSFSLDLQGVLMSGYVYQANGLAARFQNETGGVVDLDAGTIRWKALTEGVDTRAVAAATWNPALVADGAGQTQTIAVPGAAMGDFVVFSHTSSLAGLITTAWVSAAGTVSVRLQNETGGNNDVPDGTLKAAILRETGDYFGAATYDPPSLADGAGATTTIAVPGVKLGDPVVAAFSVDLAGVLMIPYVSAADVVSVRFQNETGAGPVDLAPGTLRVMAWRNS